MNSPGGTPIGQPASIAGLEQDIEHRFVGLIPFPYH